MVQTLDTSDTFPCVSLSPSSQERALSSYRSPPSLPRRRSPRELTLLLTPCSVPFPYIVLAHNQRYPSPYGKHILSSDVISRTFHPATNSLRTTRLILKRGKVPRWAPQVIQRIDTTWVLEETEVHVGLEGPDGTLEEGGSAGGPRRELRTRSRNIDRTEFMEVFEWQVFRQKPDDPLACVPSPSPSLLLSSSRRPER